MQRIIILISIFSLVVITGCAGSKRVMVIETTAYCGCGKCCSWERGTFDFWNKYISEGAYKGKPYSGLTASGTKPKVPHPGLFSLNSLTHPWMIPIRILFFPWLLLPQDGTLAADTKYYPFGTRMYIPGYGKGVVEDRGGAIKGPKRLDLYHWSHRGAMKWGRKKVPVTIYE